MENANEKIVYIDVQYTIRDARYRADCALANARTLFLKHGRIFR